MSIRTTHRQMGSKARVARTLLELMPPDASIWVEGFAGTAAMTLAKAPHAVEHVNDLNGDVVNLFRVLIEREASFVEDIRLRLDHAAGKGAHSASVKNRNRKADPGPLFKGAE
jgi:site-specific DNA-adenine methylase